MGRGLGGGHLGAEVGVVVGEEDGDELCVVEVAVVVEVVVADEDPAGSLLEVDLVPVQELPEVEGVDEGPGLEVDGLEARVGVEAREGAQDLPDHFHLGVHVVAAGEHFEEQGLGGLGQH